MYISDKYCFGTSIDYTINITNGKKPFIYVRIVKAVGPVKPWCYPTPI